MMAVIAIARVITKKDTCAGRREEQGRGESLFLCVEIMSLLLPLEPANTREPVTRPLQGRKTPMDETRKFCSTAFLTFDHLLTQE